MTRQLAERKYPELVAFKITYEIFGKQQDWWILRVKMIFEKHKAKKADWLKREIDNTGVVPGFFD